MFRAFTAASVLVLMAPPAVAIIMRHDVDDARYIALGNQHRGALVQLGLPSSEDHAPMLYSGMGTLIAPDWVVTAAHAAEYMQQNPPPEGVQRFVYYKGRGYAVDQIITHPQYDGDTYANDIALIHLGRAVRAPEPACLYEHQDEQGRVVTLVGTGFAGNGRDGPREDPDGMLRGATVRVDTAEATQLTWRFHAPSDRAATPLEGISGPGDSGGPAFITTSAGDCIAGVSSNQRIEVELDPNGHPLPNQGEGRYGVIEVYTRVSQYLPWIRATMAARPEAWPPGAPQ
jgi:secreted trypsin-like serine protease